MIDSGVRSRLTQNRLSDETQCLITEILVRFGNDHGNYALFCWYYAFILCPLLCFTNHESGANSIVEVIII